ncbi:bifunctional hydroxymethylpyrimidine kinase/phosphomethylpyrimidine kinase [Undibacterium sp. Ren11W]|uniref:bifunctional hydroxymethylpyrimidine kinase/phosphomethylpyrimidine kinase n=1 Tax=Undibacterium sp. Ren11W TaxID=3413045 RepID=UPI003BF21A23
MQNQIPPLILTFGESDPVAAAGVQADLATFIAMGCHGLPVLTAILIGDTSQVDNIHPLEAELVSDQARTLLEDMEITAIKIGQIGSVENITVIAEIISDYPEMPVVLDPFSSTAQINESEEDDCFTAIRELLIPQASLLLISAVELSRLAESWRTIDSNDKHEDISSDALHMVASGCEYVLVTGIPGVGDEEVNTLFADTGIVRSDHWKRIPGLYLGAGETLSAGITAALANGLKMSDAVHEAQEFTVAALLNAQRFGMGRLVPNRFFWAIDSYPHIKE